MARILSRTVADLRQMLLALLAIALVLRIGGACEAMAATPATPAVGMSHCAEMPAKPAGPIKSDVATCTLCIALPDARTVEIGAAPRVTVVPVAALADRLAGLSGAPAPPPPKIV